MWVVLRKFVDSAFGLSGGVDPYLHYELDLEASPRTKRLIESLGAIRGYVNDSGAFKNFYGAVMIRVGQENVQSALASARRRQLEESIATEKRDVSSVKSEKAVYQFTQNNYSPKELSRVEIRRDTERLLSTMSNRTK